MEPKHSPYMSAAEARVLHDAVEIVPDFPKPGILFRNVLPALARPSCLRGIIETLCGPYAGHGAQVPDLVVGIESRGFILAAAMALHMGIGFVPVRKAGKLPGRTDRETYALEYGTATVELQHGIIRSGSRVVVVDDLLATGGTAAAASALVRRHDASVISFDFAVELADLGGRERLLRSTNQVSAVHSLLTY